MSNSTTQFDPYYHWLGIPPHEQPPHAYRLLGVQLFEPNLEVISNAADRQMAHLRVFQSGPRSQESQTLLNEVAAARLCLLDPQRKANYDFQLHAALLHASQATAVVVPVEADNATDSTEPHLSSVGVLSSLPVTTVEQNPIRINVAADVSGSSKSIGRSSQDRSKQQLLEITKILGGGLGGCVIALLFLWHGLGLDPFNIMRPKSSEVVTNTPRITPPNNPRLDDPDHPPIGYKLPNSTPPKVLPPGFVPNSFSPSGIPPGNFPPSDLVNDGSRNKPDTPNDSSSATAEKTPSLVTMPPPSTRPVPESAPPSQKPPDETAAEDSSPVRQRLPKPSDDEQKVAQEAINNVFNFNAAKSNEEKQKLINDLIRTANETPDKPAERFVLFRKGMELAQEAGDATLAVRIVELVAKDFDIDEMSVREKALHKTLANVREERTMEAYLMAAKNLIDEAMADNRYDLAKRLADASYEACDRSFATKYRKYVNEGRTNVRNAFEEWNAFQEAEKKIKSDPNDPDANLIAGRWYCLRRDNWAEGLTKLALGSDEGLNELAKRELAGLADAKDQIQLADDWLSLSKSKNDYKDFQTRARYWYSQALPNLSGLEKAKAESRLSELGSEKKGIFADRLIIWNTHNATARDRGATQGHIFLKRKDNIVWQRRDLRIPWNPTTAGYSVIDLPNIPFDTIRIEITDWQGRGGGLGEIEVLQNKVNIARQRKVTASDYLRGGNGYEQQFEPDKIIDGIFQAPKKHDGYWLLPDKTAGWIEISFKDLVN